MQYRIDKNRWKQILSFLRNEKGIHTRKEEPLRLFIEAIWYVARSGCQWRLLPEIYGNWRAVHRRFKRWADLGIWERLMKQASDPDTEIIMIDATIVRAHACSAGYNKKDYQDQHRH
jgi:transposase